MAKLILSRSQTNLFNKPYKIKSLDKVVYTVEGLMSIFLYEYKECFKEALEFGYIHWIQSELGLIEIAQRLEAIPTDLSQFEKYRAIIQCIRFFTDEEWNVYANDISNWVIATPGSRLKVIGDEYLMKKEYISALEFYQKAMEIEKVWGALNNSGICYMHLHQYALAEDYFKLALNDVPTHTECIQNLFYTYCLLEKYDKAESLIIEKADLFDRNQLSILFGFKYEQHGDIEKALIAYLQAYEMSRDENWLIKVGQMYLKNNQLKEAKDLMKTLKDTEQSQYKMLEAQILIEDQQMDMAIHVLEELLESPLELEFYLLLIKAYRINKQKIKAIEIINRAVNVYGNQEELFVEMALIAKGAGKMEDYYQIYDQIINRWKGQCRSGH